MKTRNTKITKKTTASAAGLPATRVATILAANNAVPAAVPTTVVVVAVIAAAAGVAIDSCTDAHQLGLHIHRDFHSVLSDDELELSASDATSFLAQHLAQSLAA